MERILELDKELCILGQCLTLVSWDQSTEINEGKDAATASMTGYLSGLYYEKISSPELEEALLKQKDNESLSDRNKAIIRELEKSVKELKLIDKQDYMAYQMLMIQAQSEWQKAKELSDFNLFKETLKKIIAFQKKFAALKRKDESSLYDVLLNEYEPGFTSEKLDEFFSLLRSEIVPLLKKIQESGIRFENPVDKPVDKAVQEKFNRELAEYIGFDLNCGIIKQSEHPFTTSLLNKDVRFTNHFYEDRMESALFSTIHEGGHGIYEQGVSDDLMLTSVGGGASMGLHESQSRFYENMIGRNKQFWKPLLSRLNEAYGLQMELDAFISYINQAEASLIRIEADELTYPLHIMIRYEIEKELFNGDVEVEQLPLLWNQKVKEILGIDVPDDARGVLQDVHWAQGMFGYFPSYALGSAVAAQIEAAMRKELDFDELLETGNLAPIKHWLNQHIHQYGHIYPTNELLMRMMDEEFNPQYYVDYLKNKYTELYSLNEE